MRITFRLKEDVKDALDEIIEYLSIDGVKITPSDAIRYAILHMHQELNE